MADLAAVPEPLRALLYGKRRHRRHRVSLNARMDGPRMVVPARAVDLSAGGALLRVDMNYLVGVGPIGQGPLGIQRYVGGPFTLTFTDTGFEGQAEVVRVAWQPGETHHLYVGCRFGPPLSAEDMARLGLEPDAEAEPEDRSRTAISCLPLEARSDPIDVSIHDGGEGGNGALYEGRVVGLGRQALAAQVPNVGLPEISTRLGSRPLRLRIRQGTTPIWDVGARLLAVRQRETPGGGVELALLAESPPVRELRSAFVPRSQRIGA